MVFTEFIFSVDTVILKQDEIGNIDVTLIRHV